MVGMRYFKQWVLFICLSVYCSASAQEVKKAMTFDDMVDTAGTITKAADIMKEAGATSVRSCWRAVLQKRKTCSVNRLRTVWRKRW